jgi:hypothetical protein
MLEESHDRRVRFRSRSAIASCVGSLHLVWTFCYMNDLVDLRRLLEAWPYDPDNNVRLVRGGDGRMVMQVRLAMGIEQYELDGRPDGRQPHGHESAFDYQVQRVAQAQSGDATAHLELTPEACAELFDEGTLYYFRYLNLFRIKDWTRALRDTARNLRLFDFVRRYAAREEDQLHLEKWRPYLLRMNAIAATMIEVEQGHHGQAVRRIQTTIRKIEALEEMEDETFTFEQQRSVLALKELSTQLEQTRPLSAIERLERDLRLAVDQQDFERAATLRDRIRALRQGKQVKD